MSSALLAALLLLSFVTAVVLIVIGYRVLTDNNGAGGLNIAQELHSIKLLLGKILALVEIDQSVLDGYATTLSTIAASLSAEIAALKVAVPSLPAANVAAIDAQIAALTGLEPPAPAPSA